MSASGLSRHSKPAAHTPQKKLVDGLKQSPHDSPSCLVSFSKSFKINYKVYYGTQHVLSIIFSPDNLEIWKIGRLTYRTLHCPDWIHNFLVLNMPLRCHLKDNFHHMFSHHNLARSTDFPRRWHKIPLHRKLLLRNRGSCKLTRIRFLYMLVHIRLVLKWKEEKYLVNVTPFNQEILSHDLENDWKLWCMLTQLADTLPACIKWTITF